MIIIMMQNYNHIHSACYFHCRITELMESIVGGFTEEAILRSNQLNVTNTFTSFSKNITYSGFKVS